MKKILGNKNNITLLAIIMLLVILAFSGCGASNDESSDNAVEPSTSTNVGDEFESTIGTFSDVVSWSDADQYVGEYVTVEGPVVSTYYAESSNGSPTFLDVGGDYSSAERFTVVIWEEDRDNFSSAPEDMYAGETIKVSGTVEMYKGSPEIEITSPDDIEIK